MKMLYIIIQKSPLKCSFILFSFYLLEFLCLLQMWIKNMLLLKDSQELNKCVHV